MTTKASNKLMIIFLLIALSLSSLFINFSNNSLSINSAVLNADSVAGLSYTFSDSATCNNISLNSLLNPDNETSLKAYSKLTVKNSKINTEYSGWKYSSFVEYLDIVRTDGRPIYDDDGIMDVSWWNDDELGDSTEVVNYASDLYVKTTLMPYNYSGFLGTIVNAKWSSNASFYITWDRGEDPEDVYISYIHDLNANTMGSGAYRNNGVNPGNEYYKLCDMNYCNSPYVTVCLDGTAYCENGWWGGTGSNVDMYSFLSGFIPRADRTWTNSLTFKDNVQVGSFNGKTAYYFSQPYVATATNLNNYIKVNDTKVTPISDKTVIPFADGFRIAITDEGYKKISIENGSENTYTDYYCFLDSTMPDVTLNYLNSKALDNVKQNAVVVSDSGVKTQKITGGIFKDQVQINFEANETESPESAYYILNGTTYNLTSGTWLNQSGNYKVVVSDLVGNTKTIEFTIDTDTPSSNLNRLENDNNYKVSKWYLTSLPYGFTDYGTYSFLNYSDALNKAKESEISNLVTTYYLSNADDFKYSNLVAGGDSVKVGNYYYYKSATNPDLYVYYFSDDLLDNAVTQYASEYVSSPQYYKYSTLSCNDYGTNINSDIYQKFWCQNGISAHCVNDFTFKTSSDYESYKIYYDYINDDSGYIEFLYNVPFKNQTTNHGLYLIKEVDIVGHERYYYVFLDLQAPTISATAKTYGSDTDFNLTVSQNDIPENDELIYYFEDFETDSLQDDDMWYVMKLITPNGTVSYYTYLDELPDFESLGTGEFQITLYDRNANNFSFKLVLVGNAPKVIFETINANTQIKISIKAGESFNEIMELNIYRNEILLNSENGYDEYPADDSNNLIYISPSTTSYIFNKGGIYKVEIADNFGRTTTCEFKFEKDIPVGILKGVTDNGTTNGDVEFVFNETKYYAVIYENEIQKDFEYTESSNLQTIYINADVNAENSYIIYLYDISDFENFNTYKFTIKTITPSFTLYGVNENETTAQNVYATWNALDNLSACYTLNDSDKNTYTSGQTINLEGDYSITVTDELGNFNTKVFTIDKTLDFSIYEDDILSSLDEIRYTNKSIQIVNNEPLQIEVTKDEVTYPYEFNLYCNDEGDYLIYIYDDYGNVKYFEAEIDKTCPSASLVGVENNGVTASSVYATWQENNLIATIYKDSNLAGSYTNGSTINLNGIYTIKIKDLADNVTTFNFTIDNEIEFDINIFNGGYSNGGIRVLAKEELTIEMYKDNILIDYAFEQILNDAGFYNFILTDSLGNQTEFNFTILNSPLQRFEQAFDSNIEISGITNIDNNTEIEFQDNTVYLVDEGNYAVTFYDENKSTTYTFSLEIDTTPPTIELVGVENGGKTSNDVSAKNASENPVYITATKDGIEFEYELGETITNSGAYQIVVTDRAGNSNIYEFTKVYALNGASIVLLGGMLAVVVVIILFIVRSRKGFYKSYGQEEMIEETTEEIKNVEMK